MNLVRRELSQLLLNLVVTALLVAALVAPNQARAFENNILTTSGSALMESVTGAARDHFTPAADTVIGVSYREAGSVVSTATPLTHRSPVLQRGGPGLVLEGQASYYSRAGCLGCNPALIMANGQPLNDAALTIAIGAHYKHLVGYRAEVTSLVTGQSVIVRITDTGGFYQEKYGNRVVDLTIATKQAIGMTGGVGQVRVEIL